MKRRAGEKSGIAILGPSPESARIDSPSVPNNEHNRLRHPAHSPDDLCRTRGSFVDNRERAHHIALMKWRNQILALSCLAAFVALGILYFKHWVVQKPFGIILFVGEGLSSSRLAAARAYAVGSANSLPLDSFPNAALLRNPSLDFATPDQAAAATALATGNRTNNGLLSTDPSGTPLVTLIELARRTGRATGLITNGRLTDATSAAFYAHSADATNFSDLAAQLVDRESLDLVMGGGAGYFLPETKGGARKDERDLLLDLRRRGFDVVRTRAELEAIPPWRRPKLFGGFALPQMAYADEIEARGEQPALSDMVRKAIELLQFNRSGYVLVVDAGLMGEAARKNQGERALSETAELARAASVAQRYAGATSIVLVAGDVAIGGLTLNGYPYRTDTGVALLGLNSAGQPWLTWASGPNGPAAVDRAEGERDDQLEPALIYAESALNTVEDVIAFGSGQGTDRLRGVVDNTLLFQILIDHL